MLLSCWSVWAPLKCLVLINPFCFPSKASTLITPISRMQYIPGAFSTFYENIWKLLHWNGAQFFLLGIFNNKVCPVCLKFIHHMNFSGWFLTTVAPHPATADHDRAANRLPAAGTPVETWVAPLSWSLGRHELLNHDLVYLGCLLCVQT